ncbi:MAG: type II toxin-antitoxin system PemK/MazF family toxin [Nitrospirota bacterium]|nr:type II toxin-antitoxin system PemK/MazF family toxin [Nitrospirota bacterium]
MVFQNNDIPIRGEIWLVDFSPSIGSEIKEQHPALIVSVDELNESPWGLVVVCPITTFRKEKPFRLHVLISPPEGGIKHVSVIRCDQIKSVSIQRFFKKWGAVNENTMRKVDYILRRILNL